MTDPTDKSPPADAEEQPQTEPESVAPNSGLDIEADALLDSLLADGDEEFDDEEEVTGVIEPRPAPQPSPKGKAPAIKPAVAPPGPKPLAPRPMQAPPRIGPGPGAPSAKATLQGIRPAGIPRPKIARPQMAPRPSLAGSRAAKPPLVPGPEVPSDEALSPAPTPPAPPSRAHAPTPPAHEAPTRDDTVDDDELGRPSTVGLADALEPEDDSDFAANDFEDLDADLLESVPPGPTETIESIAPEEVAAPEADRDSGSFPAEASDVLEPAATSEPEPLELEEAPPPSPTPEAPEAYQQGALAPHTAPLPPPTREFADTLLEDEPTELLDSLPPDEVLGTYSGEQPAHEYLAASGRTTDWRTHAEWFERHAATMTDPAAKARSLLVASEHYAQLGEFPKARTLANDVHAIQPALAMGSRQLRWLAALENDYKAVSGVLELETRAAPTPLARAHAANLASDIHRVCLDDTTNARRKLDLAQRLLPEDPRPFVLRLADQLGQNAGPPRLKPPESEQLAALAKVARDLERLRSLVKHPSEPASTPVISFDETRKNLRAQDLDAAFEALARLGRARGMGNSVLWLTAALAAPSEKTRERAITALGELIQKYGSVPARQALAARALEQGNPEGANQALYEQGQLSPAFDTATRVVLKLLTSQEPSASDIEELAFGELSTLAAAAVATNSKPDDLLHVQVGDELQKQELNLARALAALVSSGASGWHPDATPAQDLTALQKLRNTLQALMEGQGIKPLTQLLSLEFALADGTPDRVAQVVADWPGVETGPAKPLASALILEASGDRATAKEQFRKALELDPQHEGAVRALLVDAEPPEGAELLAKLADSTDDPTHAGFLLLEAALLRSDDPQASEEHLVQAATSAPDLPLVYMHGEQQARQRGDAELLLSWLRQRRENATDKVDKAFDFVREALLVAESDMDLAANLLGDAVLVRPEDVALQELHERLSAHPGVERGKWREQAASQASDSDKFRLLQEAAVEYQRANDLQAAARAAKLAQASQPSAFGEVYVEHLHMLSGQTGELSEHLLKRARAEEAEPLQREVYERLSELDERKGDHSSSLLWQSAILERAPTHLPALRRLEHEYISTARWDDLEAIALELARQLDPAEADARAIWVAQNRILGGKWQEAQEAIELACKRDKPSLWALRAFAAQTRGGDELEATLRVELELMNRAGTPLDTATLSLRAAEIATRLSKLDAAKALLQRSIQKTPEHLIALTTLADVLDAMDAPSEAAEALEAAASSYRHPAHQVDLWHQAAVLWQDSVNNPQRAIHALEAALDRDIKHNEAFRRLQDIYIAEKDTEKLAELLERRLEHTEDPEERVSIEVMRGQALAGVGDKEAAKRALAAALDASPEHAEALDAFAQLCMEDGDWSAAEQAWIRLARHVGDVTQQASIYARLGALYDDQLPNPQRAELAYQEVLKRDPDNTAALERLVEVNVALENAAKAIELQKQLIEKADTKEQKRDRTLQLAHVVQRVSSDTKEALNILEAAKKTYGNDSRVLRAHAELLQTQGQDRALTLLLDRASNDARRALTTGRFDVAFFETLSTVSELRGSVDGAVVAQATLAALRGEASEVSGAGPRVADSGLDELLAPTALSTPLRALLRKAGYVLDAAYPVDLKTLKAEPLTNGGLQLRTHVEQVAQAFGIEQIEVFSSPALGPVCMPISAAPARIVYGQSLLSHDNAVARYFLLIRALKIIQTGSTTLCRTAPIELWPLVAGFLKLFAANWDPPGADERKTAQATQRIRSVVPPQFDNDVPVLALEVIGSIGNRASQLGVATNQFGNRAALLAVGDPSAALQGVALAAGREQGLPETAAERLKWVVRNSEARDLAVFSVSEQYFSARAALGVQAF